MNADGSLDATFNQTGIGFNNTVESIVLQPDGKVLVGGYFTSYNGTTRNNICRLNVDGSLDATFDTRGSWLNNFVWTLALQPDGKVLVGGSSYFYNGTTFKVLARFFGGDIGSALPPTTTSLTPSGGPVGSTVTVIGSALDNASSVTINGTAASVVTNTSTQLVVTVGAGTTTGSVVVTTPGGTASNLSFTVCTVPAAPTITASGSTILSAGSSVTLTAPSGFSYLWSTGATTQSITVSTAASYTVQTIAGACTSAVSAATVVILSSCPMPVNTPAGTLDTCFASGTTGFQKINGSIMPGSLSTLILQPDGKILVLGDFNSCDNEPIPKGICRLNADGTLDGTFTTGTAFRPSLTASVSSFALQPDGKVLVGGTFSSYYTTTRNNICRLNTDGSLDSTFDSGNGFSAVSTLALLPDGKVLVSGNRNGSPPTFGLYRLNSDGSLDSSFNQGTGIVNCGSHFITLQPDGKVILWGTFYFNNGTVLYGFFRLNSDGTLDTSFGQGTGFTGNGSYYIYALALQPDGKLLVGGTFTSYNGTSAKYICRLNSDGSLDDSFSTIGTGFNQIVVSLASQPDGKVLVGGAFTKYNGAECNRFCRLSADGSLDSTFNSGAGFYYINEFATTVYEKPWVLLLQPDGKVLAGGGFSYYNSTYRGSLARLFAYTPQLPTTTSISPTGGPVGTSVTITGTNLDGATSVTINGTSATITTNNSTQLVITVGAGTTTGSVVVTTPGGAASNLSFTVCMVPAAPTITAESSTTLCRGESVRLTSSATTGNLWDINGVTYRTIVINSTGSYSVRQIVGACTTAASAPVVVTVISSLKPTITASGPTTLCGGSTVTLNSNSPTGSLWSTGETTPSITVNSAASYTVQAVTTGCLSTASSPVVVTVDNAPPPPTITTSGPTSICPGTNVRLTSSATTGNIWSLGDLPYRTLTINSSGTYTVRQVVGACTTAASLPVSTVRLASCSALPQARIGDNENELLSGQPIGVQLYPNPVANGLLTVASESVVKSVKVFSVTGMKVYEATLNASFSELSVPLKPGTYLVETQLENGTDRRLIHWE